MEKGILMAVSGPSGVGKGSVLKNLASLKGVAISISATTRKKREFEKDGIDYFFVSREEFKKHIENGDMLEYNEYCGNFYGTIKSKLDILLKENKLVLLEIDVNGTLIVSKKMECVKIFLLPPSLFELKKRLVERKTETASSLNNRLKEAVAEIKKSFEYDYIVVNKKIEEAVEDIKNIARAEALKVKKCRFKIEKLLENGF